MIPNNLIHLFPRVDTSPFLFGGPNIPGNQEQQEFDENHEPVEEWFDEDGIPIQMDRPEYDNYNDN